MTGLAVSGIFKKTVKNSIFLFPMLSISTVRKKEAKDAHQLILLNKNDAFQKIFAPLPSPLHYIETLLHYSERPSL